MKLSDIRNLKNFCNALDSDPCYRTVLDNVLAEYNDFEVDNVRFIKASEIDNIQVEEIESDAYCLGCFKSEFLAHITGVDSSLIDLIQESEGYEKLGEWLINEGHTKQIQEEYARLDGYGHHFNSHDSSEEEITIDGIDYYVFDNH